MGRSDFWSLLYLIRQSLISQFLYLVIISVILIYSKSDPNRRSESCVISHGVKALVRSALPIRQNAFTEVPFRSPRVRRSPFTNHESLSLSWRPFVSRNDTRSILHSVWNKETTIWIAKKLIQDVEFQLQFWLLWCFFWSEFNVDSGHSFWQITITRVQENCLFQYSRNLNFWTPFSSV